MINDEIMIKAQEIMGDGKSLMFLQGQLRNPERRAKEDGDVYYLADLKVPRIMNDSIYGVSFDIFHVCFGSDFVKESKCTDDTIKEFKNNEVILFVRPTCQLKQMKREAGRVDKLNNVNFFVNDIMLLQTINKSDTFKTTVVNL